MGEEDDEERPPVGQQQALVDEGRPTTPARDGDNFLDGFDIYNATPRAPVTTLSTGAMGADAGTECDVPDDDDLDALMAEEDTRTGVFKVPLVQGENAPTGSIFSNGSGLSRPGDRGGVPDEDDMDVLIAEAEGLTSRPGPHLAVDSFSRGDSRDAQLTLRGSAASAIGPEDDLDCFPLCRRA